MQQFAIPTEALPENVRILSQEMAKKTDMFHPLNTVSPPNETSLISDSQNRAKLFEYTDVYASSLLFAEQNVMIGNFVYQYESPEMAKVASSILKGDLQEAVPLLTESETTFILQGDEGDIVYWYIASKEDTLVLVVANGIDTKSVEATFNDVISLID